MTGQLGRVSVMGAATLHATLDVAPDNNFTPSPGSTFDIITYPSHVAVFDTITLPPTLQASVDATRVRLTGVIGPGPTVVQQPLLAARAQGSAVPAPAQRAIIATPAKATNQVKPATKSNGARLINSHAPAPKAKQTAPVQRAAIQQPAWLHDFLLDLGAPDPNHDIRLTLPFVAPLTGRR